MPDYDGPMAASLIGVDVGDFRLPLKDGIEAAAQLAFRAIELSTAEGDAAPQNLSPSGRRHLRRYVDDHGLTLAALTADFAGLRLTDPRTVSERVERTCQAIDLARELKVPLVTAAVGALTHPESGEPAALSLSALRRIGEHADSRNVLFCLRPSYDNRERIARVLDSLGCPAVRIGLDPAACVMAGANPTALLEELAAQVAIVHARDATAGLSDRPGAETRLGEGEVDFVGLVALLAAADYTAPFIVRRCDSRTPRADLTLARERLAKLLGR